MSSAAISVDSPADNVSIQSQPSISYEITRVDTRTVADLASVWFQKYPTLTEVQRTPSPSGYACTIKQMSLPTELGFAYARVARKNLFIDHLFVETESKSQKVITDTIKAILEHLITNATKNNCEGLTITQKQTSHDHLYGSLGFIKQGEYLCKPITRKSRGLHFPFLAKKDKLPVDQPFHVPLDEYPGIIVQLKQSGNTSVEEKVNNLAKCQEIFRMIGVKSKDNQYRCVALLNLTHPDEIKIDTIVHFVRKISPNIKSLRKWLLPFSIKSGRKMTYTPKVITRQKRAPDGLPKPSIGVT